MADVFLSMKNVNKRYVGVQALSSVDFEIEKGEIHCLVGENGSGKSTLIKIVSGAVEPDDGAEIEIDGKPFQHFQAIDSIHKGIEVIYQDLSLFPNLTVAENIALSQVIATGNRIINYKEIQNIAKSAMARIEVDIPLDALVGEIAIADQQLVAICRALTSDVQLLIMDEPTSSLTKKEIDALFGVVKDMQSKGIATLFVSHKLNEVLQIAERVTVLRDGKKVGTFPSSELDDEKLTMLMTGKKVEYSLYRPQASDGQALLEVRRLAKRGNFKAINFELKPGEILGITGLLGSGRTELALALFGVSPADSGEILLSGRPVKIRSVQDAIRHGIGYVPEDRLVEGLVMPQAVHRNLVLTVLSQMVNRFRLIDRRRIQATVNQWVDELSIKVSSVDSPVQTLSGGNQQRVVLAKWIATNPKVLILDGPTIGIDVAAKHAIHEIIRGLVKQGIAILLISDEVQEVYNNCNRIIVMHKGLFIKEFETTQTTAEAIQGFINSTV